MAASKLLLFCAFLALIFVKIRADSAPEEDLLTPEAPDSSLKIELDRLKSKISFLESSTHERTRELESKDESINRMEKIIQEKSDSIASLQSEIESLQQKISSDAKEQVGKAHERAGELEKQVKALRKEIETQDMKKDALEARASVAEKRIKELNFKLENLQKINDEQKARIRKTERALQVAEEEMMKANLKATSISNELKEVHGAWLPHWFGVHLGHYQSYMLTQWNERGRPALDVTIRKVLEQKALFEKWAEPHIETVKTKWIPVMQEWWLTFVTYLEPHMQTLTAKTVEVYHASKSSVAPHFVKLQKMADPYFQEAKKFTNPYIGQITTVTRPYFDKASVALKPYTKNTVRAYKRFIKSVAAYHRQVQGIVLEILKSHAFTEPFASKELVWFAASALLALPAIFLFKLCSAIFCKKAKQRTRSSHTNHTRRRAKRVHSDK
ncbi:hypothetical protein L1049_001575 [Liquidambar formosana]|uniref:Uncharacterized protein n=1 Tax=Liquidambar formosana TaxID=63359 RepID=A0AAP0NCR4_LIQFO